MADRPPKEAYCDANWFAKERETVFQRSWVFAGLIHDFQEAGDYRITQCGAASIAVVLNKNGELSAMHNVCRHRGAELLDGQ